MPYLCDSWRRIQVLARSCLDDKLQQRGLRLLSKICKTHRIIPSSYVLHWELVRVGRVHYKSRFAVVNNGEYSGYPVAIKHLTVDKADAGATLKVPSINLTHYRYSAFNQRLCREIIIWKHLSHANIMPLLGVLVSADRHCFRILTEWMPNGNVMQFARSNPNENRLRLVSSLAVPLRFFHAHRLLSALRGDIRCGLPSRSQDRSRGSQGGQSNVLSVRSPRLREKQANVLVDNTGTARLADFGLMSTVALSTVLFSESDVSPGGTLRWMSPELLDPTHSGSEGRPTRESDCYALGMVIYEVSWLY